MADAVVTDSAKTVVFDDRNGYKNYGPQWSAEPTFGQTADAINVGQQTSHLLNALLTNFGFVREGIARTSTDIAISGGQTRDRVSDAAHSLDKSICDTRDTIREDGNSTRERVHGEGRILQQGQFDIRKDICDTRDAVRTEAAATRMEILKEACLTREVVKDRVDALARQELEHFADLRLQASENTARLSKELSDCCCEMKILFKDQTIAGLQGTLATTQQQGLVNAIVNALNNRGPP